tara:strand:- start:239 stop:1027 length:789 start_codon:yes stop_codon:yes gene_type:complete
MFGFVSQSFRAGQRPVIIVTNPDVLPNLQVWYNADLGNTTNFNVTLANGDDISQWKDRSAFGHNLNKAGNASVKPNWYANQAGVGNTLGVISFNGTSESLDINPISWMQSQTGFSLFVVAKANTVGITSRTISATNTGGFQISHNTSNWRVEAGGCSGVSTVTGVGDTSRFNIYALIFDGSGIGNTSRLRFRYNKVPQTLTYTGTAGTITSASASTFYVGVSSIGNSQYFSGDIAEMIMFTRTLNSSEIGGVESYMTAHWNL